MRRTSTQLSSATSKRPWANLYKRKRWLDLRASVLRQEPLCRYCKALGIETKATVVDHRKPHKGDLRLFFSRRNLQALCKPCHDKHKQRKERGGVLVGSDTEGNPVESEWW